MGFIENILFRADEIHYKDSLMLPRLLVLSALFAATPAGAAGPTAIPVEQVADAYVRPHELVEVEHGRKMNLYCKGTGSPTVVFDSGLSDWSNTWALIQQASQGATAGISVAPLL